VALGCAEPPDHLQTHRRELKDLDEIIHQSTRLRIMTVLCLQPENDWIIFVRLKALTQLSDGNLGAHIDTLARAGYVEIEKEFIGKKPQTRIRTTPSGRLAYTEHVNRLRLLLDL